MTRFRRIIAAAALILCGTLSATAQAGPSFQGELVWANGATPTSSAHVWVYEVRTLGHYEAQPDPNGKFSISLPPGIYAVFVSAPGFLPYAKSFTIKADDHVSFKIGMTVDADNPADE